MQHEIEPRARARDRVLLQLKTRGPQTAAQLADRLGVTPMAIRQHLAALQDEALVVHTTRRQQVGRPARVWSLTERASERFPDTHADLTVELLSALKRELGEQGIERIIHARSREQRVAYRSRLPDRGAPLADRVAALARLRREEGYMADCHQNEDGSFLLVENHCPICAAATLCQGFCRDELELFQHVLGADAFVERSEHLLSEARRCAYRIVARDAA